MRLAALAFGTVTLVAASVAALAVAGVLRPREAPRVQVAATPFAQNVEATPDTSRRAIPEELRARTAPPPRAATPGGTPVVSAPRRTATTGRCPDPALTLSTILEEGVGSTSWTFLVTGECALSKLALDIRIATDRGSDARCFETPFMRRVPTADFEWSDLACGQIGFPPNTALIDGWSLAGGRIPDGVSETRLTIVYRNSPSTPPGLPEPRGLLFTWSWDGGPSTAVPWDVLPILGRFVRAGGDTIARALPLPPPNVSR